MRHRGFSRAHLATGALLPLLVAGGISLANAAGPIETPAAARGFSGGGGVSVGQGGEALQHFGGFDGSGALVRSADSSVVLRHGSIGKAYSTRQFFVAAASNVITEAGGASEEWTQTQLGGIAYYNDNTSALLTGSLIGWQAPAADSALAEISPTGLARANTVPETVLASYTGWHGGEQATGNLWVVNALPDNHGIWAGDGFDDQWQKANNIPGTLNPNDVALGMPYWMHYAFSRNPLNPNGGALVSLDTLSQNGMTLRYTRNPLATGVTFLLETSESLLANFVPVEQYIEISMPDGPDKEHVEIQLPHEPSERSRFFRIRAEKQ